MKKIELSIPNPCHEDWNKMTPEDRGRFCRACQKTVIDFSQMSDREIALFFKQPVGSICGRFGSDQLNRIIEVPKKRIPWIKYFFTISLPAFLFSLKAGAQGEVKIKGRVATYIIPFQKDSLPTTVSTPARLITVKGRVLNAAGEPINYASINFLGNYNGTMTDEAGEFTLQQRTEKDKMITISAVGYTTRTRPITEIDNGIIILNTPAYTEMGLIVVVEKKKPAIPLIQPRKMDSAFINFAVYPNPVAANASFVIEAKKLEEGRYDMHILTGSGEVVQTKQLLVHNKQEKIVVKLNAVVAGPYFIRLTHQQNQKSYTEIIIVQ